MSGDQYDMLNPGQIHSTLLSLPRRIRQALASEPTLDVSALAATAVPNGRSLLSILAHLAAAASTGREAIHDIVIQDRPSVDLAARPGPSATSLTAAIEQAAAELDNAGREVDSVAPGDWLRAGATAPGGETTALDVARDLARRTVGLLKEVETTVTALGRLPSR